MWKRKNPSGHTLPKIQNLTMYPITSEIEDSLNGLPEDIRKECIVAIKTREIINSAIAIKATTQGIATIIMGSTIMAKQTKDKAKRKTNHQQTMRLSHAGSVTRKGILKLTTDQGSNRTSH